MDHGVPTVYCLLIAEHDEYASQVVGAATSFDVFDAAAHALGEAMTVVPNVRRHRPPEDPRMFGSLMDGAAYMGRREHRKAFEFLLSARDEGRLSAGPESFSPPADPQAALRSLVELLNRHNMHPLAVDISTDECRSAGVVVVHVIIPELQPFSFIPTAQYRGHARLYAGPAASGFEAASDESGLNPWPQPFG